MAINTVENQMYVSPAMAFSDALMYGQYFCLKPLLNNPEAGYKFFSHQNMHPIEQTLEVLEKLSQGQCREASVHTLYFLSHKYDSMFKYMFLLQGAGNRFGDEKQFTYRPSHLWHCYAITQDTQGNWRAGSPANYSLGQSMSKDQLFTRVIKAKTLDTVIKTIALKDGGTWPTTKEVLASLTQRYKKPVIEQYTDDDKKQQTLIYLTSVSGAHFRFGWDVYSSYHDYTITCA